MDYPFAKTWWIDPGRILGGSYPGTADPHEASLMLQQLLTIGIRVIVNLQEPDERGRGNLPFPDYSGSLKSLSDNAGVQVDLHRLPVRDWGVPTTGQMEQIQSLLGDAVAAGRRAYVHCWGGHGRTGTVGGVGWYLRACQWKRRPTP